MERITRILSELRTLLNEKETEALNSENVSSYTIGDIENMRKRINNFENIYLCRERNPFYEKEVLSNFIKEGNQIKKDIGQIRLSY